MARTNYILVDYENVQPSAPLIRKSPDVHLVVFTGSNQTNINIGLAKGMVALGDNAELVQIAGNGRNALDFHIAFYLGRKSATESNARFYIVSKDTGFDPLITHLMSLDIQVSRHERIGDTPFIPKRANDLKHCERYVIEKLTELKTPRPKTRSSLKNSIKTMLHNKIQDDKAEEIVNALVKHHLVVDKDGKLEYRLPSATRSS